MSWLVSQGLALTDKAAVFIAERIVDAEILVRLDGSAKKFSGGSTLYKWSEPHNFEPWLSPTKGE